MTIREVQISTQGREGPWGLHRAGIRQQRARTGKVDGEQTARVSLLTMLLAQGY